MRHRPFPIAFLLAVLFLFACSPEDDGGSGSDVLSDDDDNDDNDDNDIDDDNDNDNDSIDDDDDDNDDNDDDDDDDNDNDNDDDDSDSISPLDGATYDYIDGGDFSAFFLGILPTDVKRIGTQRGMALIFYDVDEAVADGEVFPYPVANSAMALGPDGARRVAWQDVSGRWLNYSIQTAKGWETVQVWSPEDWLEKIRLAIDAQGAAHIVVGTTDFGEWPSRRLWYFTNRTGTWETTEPFPNRAPMDFALTADADGAAHLLFLEDMSDTIYAATYATNASGNWVAHIVDLCMNMMISYCTLSAPAIGLDPSATPHFLFNKKVVGEFGTSYEFRYGIMGPLLPAVSTVGNFGFVAAADIGFTAEDEPAALAYNSNLYYLEREDGSWQTELLANDAGAGVRLAMDQEHHAHGVFRQGEWLAHAERTEDGVEFTTLVEESQVGKTNAIAVTQAGRAVIAYYDRTAAEIRVAREGDKGWAIETVETLPAAPTVSLVALRLDAAGASHLAYEDGSAVVRYATDASGAWMSELVANADTLDLDLALDGAGTPHLVYADAADGKIHYLVHDGGWSTEKVDAGVRAALEIDPAGNVHLAYLKPEVDEQQGLWYARRTATDWEVEEVAASPDDGFYNDVDIALDGSGEPCLAAGARLEPTTSVVQYVIRSGGAWVVTNLPGTISSGSSVYVDNGITLAIDDAGYAHLGFTFRQSENDLPTIAGGPSFDKFSNYRYLENTSGEWRAWTLTPQYAYPVYGTLALSPTDGQVQFSAACAGGLWRIAAAVPAR